MTGLTGQTFSYSYDIGAGLFLSKLTSIMLVYDASSSIFSLPNVLITTYFSFSINQTFTEI